MSAAVEKIDHHWNYADEVEVLTFDMNGETFALEAVIVQEILDLLPETAVPGAQPDCVYELPIAETARFFRVVME